MDALPDASLRVQLRSSLASIPAEEWDGIDARLGAGGHPFASHAFLSGLETHGCLRADWGWTPLHLCLYSGETLVAAAPGYLKTNSHGEFVFDHAWANAYARYGLDYYPKWLCAVPYSPVTGPRLLARDAASRRALIAAMAQLADGRALSSVHVNFHDREDEAAFLADAADSAGCDSDGDGDGDGEDIEGDDDAGRSGAGAWLLRTDVQYHWRNPGDWRCFDDFLAAMDHKHRKNIRQERNKVARAGVGFRVVHGDEASGDDLAAMHAFYLQTFAEYGNSPALTLDFFRHLAAAMPRQLVLVLAELQGERIAGALCLRGGDTLYGRYWGATRTLPGLHFETCYYQGIDYCLREGLSRFEPGAQGEHKIARGFLPTEVRSRHRIADPQFAVALARWCAEERSAVARYAREIGRHSPFRDSALRSDPAADRWEGSAFGDTAAGQAAAEADA